MATVLTSLLVCASGAEGKDSPATLAATRPGGREAGEAPRIADVASMAALRQVRPVRVDGVWDVRLGLAGGGKHAGPWKLLYCHVTYAGEADE